MFNQRNAVVWGGVFDILDATLGLIRDIIVDYCKYLNKEIFFKNGGTDYLFHVLQNINGRVVQIYSEIVVLLKNGFADGAFARWRSMYELDIISKFIMTSDNKYELAESYCNMESRKKISILGHLWMKG